MTRQVKAKPQAVEQGSAAQDVRESEGPNDVGQRIRWISQHKNDGVSDADASPGKICWYTRAFASSSRSLPVGSVRSVAPPGLFVGASRDHDERGAVQV